MILKRISILNYKNLEEVELGFSAKLNCFFGQNGMGKTNLLDAVYFLSFCKSSGNPIDSSLLFKVSMRRRMELPKRFIVE